MYSMPTPLFCGIVPRIFYLLPPFIYAVAHIFEMFLNVEYVLPNMLSLEFHNRKYYHKLGFTGFLRYILIFAQYMFSINSNKNHD